MALQDVITGLETKIAGFVATKLNLKANESAAVTGLIASAFALIEAEAVNRGGPLLLKELAAKFPTLAQAIEAIPEVKAMIA
jgi:hypothetical protein